MTVAPTAGWKAAMDAQVDVASYLRSQLGRRYTQGFAESERRKGKSNYSLVERLPDFGPPSILQSEPIWVDEHIVDLVQAAAETWRPEPLRATDLLAPHGFVLLEKPLVLPDVHGKLVADRAFSWMTAVEEATQRVGVVVSMWSHIDDEDDYPYPEDMRAAMGHHRFLLCHLAPVFFNELDEVDDDGYVEDSDGSRIPYSATIPTGVLAFFRLAQQRILERDRVRPDRPYRRMAKRYGKDNAYVTVIRLRRPRTKYHGEPDGDPVEWKQRWIVGGHWRRQRYGKKGERPYHRHIWISPYVKGPDDKPLEIRELRAWEFVR